MSRSAWAIAGCGLVWAAAQTAAGASQTRFEQAHSRSDYVHRIELYDAGERKIDPQAPDAPPYSPAFTCGKCHDYQSILRGHHFNGLSGGAAGRPGEPWIWTDQRTGIQLPLSYRKWPGTYDPAQLGVAPWDFVLQFGRHLPGGFPPAGASGEGAAEGAASGSGSDAAPAQDAAPDRWRLAGTLEVDCMACHSRGAQYDREAWWAQVQAENFAWAPTAALGLGVVQGQVALLPDDFDPAAAAASPRGPKPPTVTYDLNRFDSQHRVWFDIVRRPPNGACYQCHSRRPVGEQAPDEWERDEDVHLRAGMTCADCHRNGLEHHTVRGYEGESHPSGADVATLSCRGCHLGEERQEQPEAAPAPGRLGAPKPLHKGLPPVHLEKLSCTACHSGPKPAAKAGRWQTALAHGLGLKAHYAPEDPPGVVGPVLLPDSEGVLYPHLVVWPAFWGFLDGGQIRPLAPETAYAALRSTLRVRRGSTFADAMAQVRLTTEQKAEVLGAERAAAPTSQLTDQEQAKLAQYGFRLKLTEALQKLQELTPRPPGQAVYVTAGKAYRLDAQGGLETFDHPAARFYAWPLAHDVRPARWSLGAQGRAECHRDGAPLFEEVVEAVGQAPDDAPRRATIVELAGFDQTKLALWNRSFRGRTAFKWVGFVSAGIVGLIVLSYLLVALAAVLGLVRRR